jgi:hypothetical protein
MTVSMKELHLVRHLALLTEQKMVGMMEQSLESYLA